MTPEQLDQIQARVDAATEGPWYVDGEEQTVRAREHAGEIIYDRSAEHSSQWAGFRPTAEFIAHVRTDVPALLALVREQQTRLDRVASLHVREALAVHEGIGEEAWCPDCRVHWPCTTGAALTATEGA